MTTTATDRYRLSVGLFWVMFLVGGSVRDALLDREIVDLDLTTDARPDEIKTLAGPWADDLFVVGDGIDLVLEPALVERLPGVGILVPGKGRELRATHVAQVTGHDHDLVIAQHHVYRAPGGSRLVFELHHQLDYVPGA